jgi:hypothetical protein
MASPRSAALVVASACGVDPALPPSRGGPFAIVEKLADYERHVAIDDLAAFVAGEPASFTVTMTTFTKQRQDAIFIREYRDGDWYSSSPSPGVIVDDVPRIEPACDGCHAQYAERLGMFTLPALREAALVDRTARITCPEEPTAPCDAAVYRELVFD